MPLLNHRKPTFVLLLTTNITNTVEVQTLIKANKLVQPEKSYEKVGESPTGRHALSLVVNHNFAPGKWKKETLARGERSEDEFTCKLSLLIAVAKRNGSMGME